MSLFKNRFWGSSLTLSFVVMGAVQGNSVFAEDPDLKKLLNLWEGVCVYSERCMLDCAICRYYSFFKKSAFTESILTLEEDLTKFKTKLDGFKKEKEEIINSLESSTSDININPEQSKELIDSIKKMDKKYFKSEYKLMGKYPEIKVCRVKGNEFLDPSYSKEVVKYIVDGVSYVKDADCKFKELKKTGNKLSPKLEEDLSFFSKFLGWFYGSYNKLSYSSKLSSDLENFLTFHDNNMKYFESYLEGADPELYSEGKRFWKIEESFSVLTEDYKNLKNGFLEVDKKHNEKLKCFGKRMADFRKKLEFWERDMKDDNDSPAFKKFFVGKKERIKEMELYVEKCADRVEKSAEQVEAIELLEEIEKDYKALVGSCSNFGNGFSDVNDNLNKALKSFKKHEGEFLKLAKKTDKKLEEVYDISFKPLFNRLVGYMNKLERVYLEEIENWKQEIIEGKISPDDSFFSQLDMEDETRFLEKNSRMLEALGEYVTSFLNESQSKDEIVKKMNSLKENETLWQKVENIVISVEVEDKNKEVKNVKVLNKEDLWENVETKEILVNFFNSREDFENFVVKLAECFKRVLEEVVIINFLKENGDSRKKVQNTEISVKVFNSRKDFEKFVGNLAKYFQKVLEESEKTLELFKSGIWSKDDCFKALKCRLLNTFARQKGINEYLFNWGVALLKLAVKQQLNADEPKVDLTNEEKYTAYLIDNKLFYVGFFDDIGKIISIINKVNKDVKIPLYEKQLKSKESNYVIDISNIYMQPMQGFF